MSIHYLGLDGEGQGRNPHRYTMLAASNLDGSRTWSVENDAGLPTKTCLDFLLALPHINTKKFSFAFNYDLTKILTDVPDELLYKLFRPELRKRPGPKEEQMKGPASVFWEGYYLNLQGTKFSVGCGQLRTVVWDIFKFYGCKFVNALKDWKVGDPALWKRMTLMKDKRGEFEKLILDGVISQEEVYAYCLEECACMAQLAKKLVDSHEAIGLPLRTFYGAGSSATVMLKKMGIKNLVREPTPEMAEAVASAFFGGRFENSMIGIARN